MNPTGDHSSLRCSFCGKGQHDVKKLIASSELPRVYICDECIAVCAFILEEDQPEASVGAPN